MCTDKMFFWRKLFPQALQGYGFSPVCVPKPLPHVVQEYGFSPALQEYGFSPVCVLMCTDKVPLNRKLFPHSSQSPRRRRSHPSGRAASAPPGPHWSSSSGHTAAPPHRQRDKPRKH
uniref:Uncharacterized protein n=1 Tax=Pundamilia nyererei TaxID=303518 RepID=A0A3B4EZL4_9CICH